MPVPVITVIIPTFNEALHIKQLADYLQHNSNDQVEVIVVDGGSTDDTIKLAKQTNATVLISPEKGRAAQMHYGALKANTDILYFVHADSLPPASFMTDIVTSIQGGYNIGRYQTKFSSSSWLLKLNAFFTRFDLFVCMGGDQSLFVTKDFYFNTGGFNTTLKIMEEYEFCERARKNGRYKILKGKILISARKYQNNSWLQVQKANYKAVQLYKKGASQETIASTYKQKLNP